MTRLRVTAIAAMARGRVIGTGNGIPWDLPADREHFRAYTAGKTLLVGRSTFEEMIGWFSDHRPIVLTSNAGYRNSAATAVVPTVEEAIDTARRFAAGELVVCGGAATYAAALPHTTDAILTEIDATFAGAARFPPLPGSEWRVTARQPFPASAKNPHSFTISHYTRR